LAAALSSACSSHRPPPPTVPPGVLLPPPPPQAGPTYRIQVGDELHIRFPYHADQNEQVPVRPDGRISLGSTGELDVVGLTPGELERLVVERSSTRLRNPEVTVVVTKIGERRVYVGGEVARPGYVTLAPGMTTLQAVLQAGGFRHTAKLDSVLLLTPGRSGAVSAARVNMQQVVEAGVPERVLLQPDDVVYVPPTWIADMNQVIDQYVRGLIPVLPRVGVGYSLNPQN
jgi:polysaccharide export outer membrane protein